MIMKLNDAEIYYESYGEGIPLLFLHGYHLDNKCLSLPIEKLLSLKEGFQRIYPDLPGMGKTVLHKRIESTDQLFDLVLQFIDRISEGRPFAVIGYSYGGYLARGLVRERKDKLLGMFLLCPVSIPDRQSRILPAPKVIVEDDAFLKTLSSDDKEFFEEMAVIQTEETFIRTKEEIIEPFNLADRTLMKNLYRQGYPFSQPVDNLGLKYKGPVQFLAGRQDSVVGYEDIYPLLEDFPNGELSVINRAGHNLAIESPDEFSRYFLRWLGLVEEFAG